MENENVRKMSICMGLERKIVGVKFITYRQEYEALNIEEPKSKMSFCRMVRNAMEGMKLKYSSQQFNCIGGSQSLGVTEVPEDVKSGRLFESMELYESLSISKQVWDSMKYIQHKIYGVIVAPLEDMESADTVIIMGNARQVMRIMQGYSYKFGIPTELLSLGNQAACSDLVAKPFCNNDINISFMCKGARMNTGCRDDEMGVGMPIQIFKGITEGVISTINPIESNQSKEQILKELKSPDELGIKIEFNTGYEKSIAKHCKYHEDMRKANISDKTHVNK